MAKSKKGEMPKRNKKNFRPTKSGAGMTKAGVKAYRRKNPGSKLQTAVTGKVKKKVVALMDSLKLAYSIKALVDVIDGTKK